jgi:glucose/arabinose dehydrogenase
MLDGLIIVVPLLAGLALIAVYARGIFNNPDVPNRSAIVLGVAALLCVAPTILNLAVKLPGGTEISLVKDQIKNQSEQIKNDVGAQGADVKGQIEALRKRIEVLEKGPGAAAAPADKQQETANKGKVVVILYADGRKDLATRMEVYLLQKGYSANAIYTDFTELAEASRQPSGTVAFVSSETDASLRNEVEKVLRPKFPEVQKVVDSSAPKLATTAVQVRLF